MRGRGNIAVLALPTAIALWFFNGYALKYLTPDPARYGIYWPRHQWLWAHLIAGTIALLLGPAQLWLGLNRRTAILHRVIGVLYVLTVGVGGAAAFYLAAHNDFSWVFGVGLGSMAAAWIITTAFATIAICLHQVQQHREWMIRSYVVTFGFVTFRLLYEIFDVADLGTMVERMTAASWLAWTLPLLVAESVLQGWKMFSRNTGKVRLSDAPYSVLPEPPAFELPNPEASYQQRH